jgi:Protein of unknown function (DUF2793)
MSQIQSARFQMPFLAVGQAQKEITHNEALLLIDFMLHPVVEAELLVPPSALSEVDAGKCWLTAANASGSWLGKPGIIACWTGASWRYVNGKNGMKIWRNDLQTNVIFQNQQWKLSNMIAAPTGGAFVDSEARTVIASILDCLRKTGSIAA